MAFRMEWPSIHSNSQLAPCRMLHSIRCWGSSAPCSSPQCDWEHQRFWMVLIFGFPEKGIPPNHPNVRWGFSLINHPYFNGDPPWLWKPPYVLALKSLGESAPTDSTYLNVMFSQCNSVACRLRNIPSVPLVCIYFLRQMPPWGVMFEHVFEKPAFLQDELSEHLCRQCWADFGHNVSWGNFI